MQPYHVPSIIALKKRVKQFHNELKTHSTESVSLGWSRDFTARMLHWDDWNALYKAHDKPLSEDGHRYKLFSRFDEGVREHFFISVCFLFSKK